LANRHTNGLPLICPKRDFYVNHEKIQIIDLQILISYLIQNTLSYVNPIKCFYAAFTFDFGARKALSSAGAYLYKQLAINPVQPV
jgi:hypothetical protein